VSNSSFHLGSDPSNNVTRWTVVDQGCLLLGKRIKATAAVLTDYLLVLGDTLRVKPYRRLPASFHNMLGGHQCVSRKISAMGFGGKQEKVLLKTRNMDSATCRLGVQNPDIFPG